MTPRRILLADADAFYVAVARLMDPEGAGKAALLIVGGSADHRGVVTSASYEARKYGVQSAMPMAQAVRLCPGAMIVPVPMSACVEKGREIREVLERFTPAVSQASSDEFYLDMTGTEKLYKDEPLEVTAQRMREAVRDATRLTVSIGGGTSRVVAKLAAGQAKPRDGATGVCIVEAGKELEFMRRFQLGDIHGIGPRFQERLAAVGLRTVEDALRRDLPQLTALLGQRQGKWIYGKVRGMDDGAVISHERAKSISRDDTFARDVDDPAQLEEKLLWLVDRASGDMRNQGLLARTVTVRIRDADFTDRQASQTVSQAVASDRVVLTIAQDLLARLREDRRTPARLLGVALSNFMQDESPAQLSLLDPEPRGYQDTPKDRAIAEAIDVLRERFGRDAIARGRTPD